MMRKTSSERTIHRMPEDTFAVQCTDPTQELSIKIPCRLAARVDAYARDNGSDIQNVVIEALDLFLREPKDRWD
jgi:hypothetical protein